MSDGAGALRALGHAAESDTLGGPCVGVPVLAAGRARLTVVVFALVPSLLAAGTVATLTQFANGQTADAAQVNATPRRSTASRARLLPGRSVSAER